MTPEDLKKKGFTLVPLTELSVARQADKSGIRVHSTLGEPVSPLSEAQRWRPGRGSGPDGTWDSQNKE